MPKNNFQTLFFTIMNLVHITINRENFIFIPQVYQNFKKEKILFNIIVIYFIPWCVFESKILRCYNEKGKQQNSEIYQS